MIKLERHATLEPGERSSGPKLVMRADDPARRKVLFKLDGQPENVSMLGTRGGRDYWYLDGECYSTPVTLTKRQLKQLAKARRKPLDPLPQRRRRPIPRKVKDEVWKRSGGKCEKCGSLKLLQFDHIKPYVAGGSNEPDNLQVLCGVCNRLKGAQLHLGSLDAPMAAVLDAQDALAQREPGAEDVLRQALVDLAAAAQLEAEELARPRT